MNKEAIRIATLIFVAAIVLGIVTLILAAAIELTTAHAQIGQAPVGGHQIGGPVAASHEAVPGRSPAHSQDQRVETLQGYTALPQSLLADPKTADQMTPDERLRSAVEFCEMDFNSVKVTEQPGHAADYSSNPDCAKVMKVWANSGAKERYEQEVAAWRASQLDREKQIISRVASEANAP